MYPSSFKDRAFLGVWALVWHIFLPFVLLYLWKRGRKEPVYFQNTIERFGGGKSVSPGTIWIHAVSLGETRAASPLIRALLDRGETILITNITAAGRTEAKKLFAEDIDAGRLYVRWCPMELPWAIRRFIRRHQPKLGMILEIEIWPQLIAQSKRLGLPMVMAQAQYPDKSFGRDQTGLARYRANAIQGFDLILAKSQRHAERFRHFGAKHVQTCGELRFEQNIPQAQLDAARDLVNQIDPSRPRLCLASTAPDEDAMLIPVVKSLLESKHRPKPFIIYVPRHPKNFESTGEKLRAAGLNFAKRSTDLGEDLGLLVPLDTECDGLFGDSLGEINFYYEIAQAVFVGDSFNGEGSHNIIEPLRLMNPVAVGPSIWGIEYPGLEALADGVLTQLDTPNDLLSHWADIDIDTIDPRIAEFLDRHGNATKKCLAELEAARLI